MYLQKMTALTRNQYERSVFAKGFSHFYLECESGTFAAIVVPDTDDSNFPNALAREITNNFGKGAYLGAPISPLEKPDIAIEFDTYFTQQGASR